MKSRVETVMFDAGQWCDVVSDPYSSQSHCAQYRAELYRSIKGELEELSHEYAHALQTLVAAADSMQAALKDHKKGLGTLNAERAYAKARKEALAMVPAKRTPKKKSPLLADIFKGDNNGTE